MDISKKYFQIEINPINITFSKLNFNENFGENFSQLLHLYIFRNYIQKY